MRVETLLVRLNGVRRNETGWMALCPAHPDKNPSLSVGEENGRVLLHCFAGCSVQKVCDVLRIKVSDLFRKSGETRKPEPRIVHDARKQITGLRSMLTPRDRMRGVTVVLAQRDGLDTAIARALALAVEGELVQIVSDCEAP